MAFTSHGHHIPGTLLGDFKPHTTSRCGGIALCSRCRVEAEEHIAFMIGEPTNYPEIAIQTLRKYLTTKPSYVSREPFSIYVITFSKTLQNWKALMGTTLDDSMVFELTHDGAKRVTYLKAFHSIDDQLIPD